MSPHNDRTRLISSATQRGSGRRAVNPPIERASTMLSDSVASMRDSGAGPIYGLDGGSASKALRSAVSVLEGGCDAWLVPSGLAAVTVPLLAMLSPGDELLATDALYGPSRRFLERWMARYGVRTRYHRADADADEVISMLGERTRLILIESPASLTFEMLDVAKLCLGAHERGIITVMDNTWAAGLAFKPLQHGVDISVQALTKYVSGHSDVLMGSICVADPEIGHKIGHTIEDMGWHVSPDDAWLALRGIRTLTLRYQEQARSGLLVAQWLSQRPEISRILYPALPSDPGHRLWLRDYSGSASVMGLIMRGGNEASAHAFLDALSLFGLGWSWGGYESLATHDTGQLAYRAQALNLSGELIRLHIGLEDPKDLIADLEVGLAAWVQQLG